MRRTKRLPIFNSRGSTKFCDAMERRGIPVKLRHTCNSGGFLDLPHAHLDMVRVGILLYGVFPSHGLPAKFPASNR